MRKRITDEMIRACYAAAKSIYLNDGKKSSQAYCVSDKTGMDEHSAYYYIDNFFRMKEGRPMIPVSAGGTEYYLRQLFNDYGTDGLGKALNSVQGYLKKDAKKVHLKLQNVFNVFNAKVGTGKQKPPVLHKKNKQ